MYRARGRRAGPRRAIVKRIAPVLTGGGAVGVSQLIGDRYADAAIGLAIRDHRRDPGKVLMRSSPARGPRMNAALDSASASVASAPRIVALSAEVEGSSVRGSRICPYLRPPATRKVDESALLMTLRYARLAPEHKAAAVESLVTRKDRGEAA